MLNCRPERDRAASITTERWRAKDLTMPSTYSVYILSNLAGMLYVGITNDLKRRVSEHRSRLVPAYTRQYNISRLVYFESTPNAAAAFAREKQIKGWIRAKKIALIGAQNPSWSDLRADWEDGAI